MHICSYLLACIKHELLRFEDAGSVKSFVLVINLFLTKQKEFGGFFWLRVCQQAAVNKGACIHRKAAAGSTAKPVHHHSEQ